MSWTADQHLAQGLKTIAEIESNPRYSEFKPRVCFHLVPFDPSDDEPWSDQASFCVRARPLLEALEDNLDVDYVGGTSGIEAYDLTMPTADWLRSRLPELLEIADKSGLHFDGWSFEPIEPADATYLSCGPTLEVFNSNSPEGKAAIEQLLRETNEMSGEA